MIHRSACLRSQLIQSFGPFKGISSSYATVFASSVQQVPEPSTLREDECADVDWDKLGFSLMPTDYMYTMTCPRDGHFEQGQLSAYGNISVGPASGVLNYGQGIFEGTKAYRKKDGNILLFRPDQNAIRMKFGADRMCMPYPSVDQFVDAVKQTTLANKRWVPPAGKGTLYIRPLLLGTGEVLGLAPAPEFTFLVYASPVGNYFKEGIAPLNLLVEEEYNRAYPGGTGSSKTIGNYAPDPLTSRMIGNAKEENGLYIIEEGHQNASVLGPHPSALKAMTRAKSRGFSDVLYLDFLNKKNLEEVSACNIFIVKGDTISTPATNGTILSGVTRKSIIEIAQDYGYKVEERDIPIYELMDADEVFCTGTAVVVAPVGTVTYRDKRVKFKTGAQSVSQELQSALVGIQLGVIEDKKGWTIELC